MLFSLKLFESHDTCFAQQVPSPPVGVLYMFWVGGCAIEKGINFHDFGIRNGIDLRNFGITNGIYALV